jgi:dihydrofolate reductase
MGGPIRIEGFAIVSADGMIADALGRMPTSLVIEADQRFFQDGLDRASAIVHGRHSHEGGARAAGRHRLILTRQVASLAEDSAHPNALLWNPAGAPLVEALQALGGPDGPLAVIGGTDVFGMFLPAYDTFHLSRADHARLPGGKPVFPEVPARTPEEALARHGLAPGERRELDSAAGVSVVTWRRKPVTDIGTGARAT